MIPLGLLRKELRQLLPWAIALYSVDAATWILGAMTSGPDVDVWAQGAPIFGSGEIRAVWLSIWALVLAFAGFPREHDDGTLAYLFSLPVTRSTLFLAKVAAAALVLLADVALSEVFRWLIQLPNPASISGKTFRLDWAWLTFWTGGAFALIAFGYALFLSVLRRFGLLVAFLIVSVLTGMKGQSPTLARANPLRLLEPDFYGTEALVPWRAFALHGALALALSALAGYFWVGRTEGLAETISRWVTRTTARVLLVLGILGTAVALVFVYGDAKETSEPAFGATAELDSSETVFASRHYRFRYPSVLRARIERLGPTADALHDQIAGALGTQAGAPIEVNLMKSSSSHAGSATWSTIRLDLSHAYDDSELARTLAHETAHVLALRVSDRRIDDDAESTRGFGEGLAEHLAWRFVPHPAGLEARWLEAVLAHRRLRLQSADLLDFTAFGQNFGEPLVYPVAMSWVAALCSACGENAPARVLRALAEPSATSDVSGRDLWLRTLQAIGCDYSRVELEWVELLRKKAAAFATELERVPDLAGGISRAGDEVIVFRAELVGKPLETCTYHLNTRVSDDGSHAETTSFPGESQPDGSIEFSVLPELVDKQTLHFQLAQSWIRNGALVRHAQRWQQTRISGR